MIHESDIFTAEYSSDEDAGDTNKQKEVTTPAAAETDDTKEDKTLSAADIEVLQPEIRDGGSDADEIEDGETSAAKTGPPPRQEISSSGSDSEADEPKDGKVSPVAKIELTQQEIIARNRERAIQIRAAKRALQQAPNVLVLCGSFYLSARCCNKLMTCT